MSKLLNGSISEKYIMCKSLQNYRDKKYVHLFLFKLKHTIIIPHFRNVVYSVSSPNYIKSVNLVSQESKYITSSTISSEIHNKNVINIS